MKKCNRCGVEKKLDNFGVNNAAKSGINACCKECLRVEREKKALLEAPIKASKAAARKLALEQKHAQMKLRTTKTCGRCKTEKPVAEFNRDGWSKDGWHHNCISCRQSDYAIIHDSAGIEARRKEEIENKRIELSLRTVKFCTTCNIEKPVSDFPKCKRTLDGLQYKCGQCSKQYRDDHPEAEKARHVKWRSENAEQCERVNRAWKEKNADKVRGYAKDWQLKNPEKAKAVRKRHIQKNKKVINAKAIQRRQIKRATDINFNMRERLRKSIRRVIKRENRSKSSLQLLGCSIDVLNRHLKDQFTEGMTEDLLISGQVQVDHIIPLGAFDMSKVENQEMCCHYSNLRPMWPIDNQIKSKRDVIFCRKMDDFRARRRMEIFDVEVCHSF